MKIFFWRSPREYQQHMAYSSAFLYSGSCQYSSQFPTSRWWHYKNTTGARKFCFLWNTLWATRYRTKTGAKRTGETCKRSRQIYHGQYYHWSASRSSSSGVQCPFRQPSAQLERCVWDPSALELQHRKYSRGEIYYFNIFSTAESNVILQMIKDNKYTSVFKILVKKRTIEEKVAAEGFTPALTSVTKNSKRGNIIGPKIGFFY